MRNEGMRNERRRRHGRCGLVSGPAHRVMSEFAQWFGQETKPDGF